VTPFPERLCSSAISFIHPASVLKASPMEPRGIFVVSDKENGFNVPRTRLAMYTTRYRFPNYKLLLLLWMEEYVVMGGWISISISLRCHFLRNYLTLLHSCSSKQAHNIETLHQLSGSVNIWHPLLYLVYITETQCTQLRHSLIRFIMQKTN